MEGRERKGKEKGRVGRGRKGCLFKFKRIRGGLGCGCNLKTEAENLEFKVSLGNIVVGVEGRKRRRRRMKRNGNRRKRIRERT